MLERKWVILIKDIIYELLQIKKTEDIDSLKNEILNIFYNQGYTFCGFGKIEIDGMIKYKNPFWTFQVYTKHIYTPKIVIKVENKKIVEAKFIQSKISKICEEFYKKGFVVKGDINKLKLESLQVFTVEELSEMLENF